MVIHANMIPLFILTVLVGAAYMSYAFNRSTRVASRGGLTPTVAKPTSPPRNLARLMVIGAVVGAGAGLIGPLIFMVPLQSCTFEPERAAIDVGFGILLFILGAILLIWVVRWVANFILTGRSVASLSGEETTAGTFRSSLIVPILLLFPTLVILAVFLYYPLIDTFRLSTLLIRLGAPRSAPRCVSNFTDFFEPAGFDAFSIFLVVAGILIIAAYQTRLVREKIGSSFIGYTIATALFVGFFARILEPDYGEVMFNTFFIAIMIVGLGLIIGLAIAYLAYQPVRGATIYRTLLIWPYAISPAIAGIIFFVMFDPVSGVINHVLDLVGIVGPEWIKDPWWARFTIIVASVWKTLGYNVLFYIAGLQTVPPELVEAAAIDGANGWQRFRNVVIPALSPITFFLIVTNLTYAFFNIFGTIDFLTKGGPAGASSVSIYEIVQLGIRSKDLGRAAAESLVLFIIVIGVTIFQFKTSGRRVTYGA